MRYSSTLVAALVLVMLTPSAAFAHGSVGDAGGLLHGLEHPISGLDHLLAMLLIGLFASQLGGRALWLVPAAFLVLLALGGALGVAGIAMPWAELVIAASVVALGALVALRVRPSTSIAMALAGLFAVFHGHVHGAEMLGGGAASAYGVGFLLGTAALHATGAAAGLVAGRGDERRGSTAVRLTGGLAALAGVALLSGLI